MSSNNFSRKKKFLWAIWCLAIPCLIFSIELTLIYYRSYQDPNFSPSCKLNQTIDCVSVALSNYSTVLCIPNSVYGMIVYFIIIILLPLRLKTKIRIFAHLENYLAIIAIISFGFSVYLAIISTFILKTLCIWCTALYILNIAFLILAILVLSPPGKIPGEFKEDISILANSPMIMSATLFTTILILIFLFIQANHCKNKLKVVSPEGHPVIIDTSGDPIIGPSDAKITIIEFSDFQCPFCRQMFLVLKKLQEKYPSDIKIIFKNFPLDGSCNPMIKGSPHPDSCLAASAAQCAHQMGCFKEFYEKLMTANNYSPLFIMKMAQECNIDPNLFRVCLGSTQTMQEIVNDILEAKKVNITGTPLLIINGYSYTGFFSEEQLDQIIKMLLQRKEPPKLE